LKASNDRGFTLVEVLVAMVILTIALVSMAELMAITLRMQMLGRNQMTATRLAQDKIDELMTQDFDANPSVAIGGNLEADDDANYFDTPTDADGNSLGYGRRWKVEPGPADDGVPANSVRILKVRVTPIVNDLRTAPPIDMTTLIRCWPCG
jgi:prepilin-type N-terminal cleavage/methylation domain-containing protein